MKTRALILTICVIASILFSSKIDARPYASDRVIVKYRSSKEAEKRPNVLHHFRRSALTVHRVPKGSTVAKELSSLRNDPAVLYAEPDYILEPYLIPNDDYYVQGSLWGLMDIGMASAWDITTGSKEIVVAVIDTGIDYTHPDLADNIWTNIHEIPGNRKDDDNNGYIDDVHGYNFEGNTSDPMDTYGHGTHCAGTIGAVMNNGIGVVGVSPYVRLMACKFLNPYGLTSDAIRAIEYAVANGARILSNSWGGGEYSRALQDAIDMAGAHGVTFVAAAGNDSRNTDYYPNYPSCYPSSNIISVGAYSGYDRSYFSNYGKSSVDVFAPGEYITSTVPGGEYRFYSGTSMACPHVSGLVALMLSGNPALKPVVIREIIIETVEKKYALNDLCVSGGIIYAPNALQEVFYMPRPLFRRVVVSGGDGDGFAESGETVSLIIELENAGNEMFNATATLTAGDAQVEVLSGESAYPRAITGAVIANAVPFTVRIKAQDNVYRQANMMLSITANDGTYNKKLAVPFSTGKDCEILIVDDDGGSIREEKLIAPLKNLGYAPMVWRTLVDGVPPLSTMRPEVVVWHCGNVEGYVLSSDELAQIRAYLQLGGAMILLGSGWAAQLDGDAFSSDILHVAASNGPLALQQSGRLWLSGINLSLNPLATPSGKMLIPGTGSALMVAESSNASSGSVVYFTGDENSGPVVSISFDLSTLDPDIVSEMVKRCVRKVLRPRLIAVGSRNSAVALSWKRPSFATITEMKASAANEQTQYSSFTGVSATMSGLRNDATWKLYPRARYDDGFLSEYGTAAICVPKADCGAALGSVGNVVILPREDGLEVNWAASLDERCAGYIVEVRNSEKLVRSVRTSSLSVLVEREYLKAEDRGLLWIIPIDSLDRPGSSRETVWEYHDVFPPDEVVNVAVEEIPGRKVKLRWSHGKSADLAGYLVDVAGAANDYGDANQLGAVNETIINNVSKSTEHFIRVRAVDVAGNVSSGTVIQYGAHGYDGSLSGCTCQGFSQSDDSKEASAAIIAVNHLLNVIILGIGVFLKKLKALLRRNVQ